MAGTEIDFNEWIARPVVVERADITSVAEYDDRETRRDVAEGLVPLHEERRWVREYAAFDLYGLHRIRTGGSTEVQRIGEGLPAIRGACNIAPAALIGGGRLVAGAGDIDNALLLDRLDGVRDHVGLVEWLVISGLVVADDATAGIRKRNDAIGEILRAEGGGVEVEIGARGDVVHDLHHRPPLVGAGRGEVVLEHVHVGGRRQRAIHFILGRTAELVEAVGHHAHGDAGAGGRKRRRIHG